MDELARVHDPAYLARLAAFCAEGGGRHRRRHLRATGLVDGGPARRRRRPGRARRARTARRGHRLRPGPAARPPRHARTGPWASASSTTWPSPRRRARRGGNGCSSSTGTCTTGTAPRTSSGTTPTCSTSRPTSIPSTRGPGRPDEVGGPARAGPHPQPPAAPRGRRATWCGPRSTRRRAPPLRTFAPDWVLVSCGFDAHRDDPLSDLQLSSGDFAELACIVREFAPAPGPAGPLPRRRVRRRRRWRRRWRRRSARCSVAAAAAAAPTSGGPGLAELRGGRRGAPDAPIDSCLARRGRSSRAAARCTSTGQCALVTQYSLTEPISMPTNSPWPRLPTTSRSAPLEASTRTGAGWPLTNRASTFRPGCSAAHPGNGGVEHLLDVRLGIEVVGDRHRPAVARRPLPRHHDLEGALRSGRPGGPPTRGPASEEAEPSKPTTILPVSDDGSAVIALHPPSWGSGRPSSGAGRSAARRRRGGPHRVSLSRRGRGLPPASRRPLAGMRR